MFSFQYLLHTAYTTVRLNERRFKLLLHHSRFTMKRISGCVNLLSVVFFNHFLLRVSYSCPVLLHWLEGSSSTMCFSVICPVAFLLPLEDPLRDILLQKKCTYTQCVNMVMGQFSSPCLQSAPRKPSRVAWCCQGLPIGHFLSSGHCKVPVFLRAECRSASKTTVVGMGGDGLWELVHSQRPFQATRTFSLHKTVSGSFSFLIPFD